MGFVISHKKNEERRAILPEDVAKLKNKSSLVFEAGYGNVYGIDDSAYTNAGASIASREDVFKCEIIVDVKLGDADYIDKLDKGKILVGWAHATQQVDFTSAILQGDHTVIAWEDIYENGWHVFYRNNEIAGEAAVMHAFRYSKKMPYDTKVCILGNGQTAKGCLRILHCLGADVDVYPRKHEDLFKKRMFEYDVVINCVMWDTSRTDRIIYKSDLQKFKRGTLIIDVSCDPHLEIETSRPTSVKDPVYEVDGVIHYAVDHTPTLFAATATKVLSDVFSKYIDEIIDDSYTPSINAATVIRKGHIISDGIRSFREKRGLFVK